MRAVFAVFLAFCLVGTAFAATEARLQLAAEKDLYSPLDEVELRGNAPEGARVEFRDGAGRVCGRRSVGGRFELSLTAGGAPGECAVALVGPEGSTLAKAPLRLEAATDVRCRTGGSGEMWRRLRKMVGRTRRHRKVEGKRIVLYVPWLRDETHVMKAYKYWEERPGELHAHFLDIQPPSGLIYDYVTSYDGALERAEVFEPRYSRLNQSLGIGYNRLPVEADVEYLAVEGVYTAWQARGDDRWMARQLPALERALQYSMTDPLRWSEEHELVKRAYTIDTWDFKFFGFDRHMIRTAHDVHEYVFNIHPDTPMCIMHGDNSGMYQACRQMARMFDALGNEEKRGEYRRLARHFRDTTSRVCWNGRYYDHWVPVTPLGMDQGGIDGSKVLSLSNPYDINRGLPDQEQAAGIIREYMRLRKELEDTHFAEWVSVYPYWPKGFSGIEPGTYVNGGIITIVAGELAKAAFHHGFEAYGADILERVRGLMEKHGGRLPCAYRPSGEVSRGIPDNWGQAAVMSAIMEGLCGLRDESTAFRHARIEPRWVAAGVGEAEVTASYGASGGYVAYDYAHDPEERGMGLRATGSGERLRFHVLLPKGTEPESVRVGGSAVEFSRTRVEESPYVDFSLEASGPHAVEIAYASSPQQ